MPSSETAKLKQIIFEKLKPMPGFDWEKIFPQIETAVAVVARLRGPEGCPWDREQDHLTIRQYLIEEAYEVLDVLDRFQERANPKEVAAKTSKQEWVPSNGGFKPEDSEQLKEELGDLLLQVLLNAQLATERGDFTIGDVAETMAKKMVARHPHVFGEIKVSGSAEVLQNWERLKKKEGKKGLIDGLPKNMPSLQKAARIGEKAHRIGFDWPDWKGSWDKVEEELQELKEAIAANQPTEIEHELGDLFFALCNLSRHLKITPEDAHRKAINRFEIRFRKLEKIFAEQGKDIHSATLEELDAVWELVKKSTA